MCLQRLLPSVITDIFTELQLIKAIKLSSFKDENIVEALNAFALKKIEIERKNTTAYPEIAIKKTFWTFSAGAESQVFAICLYKNGKSSGKEKGCLPRRSLKTRR